MPPEDTAVMNPDSASAPSKSMDDIVALCKRRGFIFPASEIYGGINGFWDFGPLGTELKNNLRDRWWRDMVICPPLGPDGHPLQIVGLDSAIIQNPKVWEASGHVGGFNDPRVDCRNCKSRFRADHLYVIGFSSNPIEKLKVLTIQGQLRDLGAEKIGPDADWDQIRGLSEAKPLLESIREVLRFDLLKTVVADGVDQASQTSLSTREQKALGNLERQLVESIDEFAFTAAMSGQSPPCPVCREVGGLTSPRQFNLMFESETGAVSGETMTVYLRPETAQGIFTNFRNIVDTMRVKVPFGIAQIGKSFRNEVTPRNYIFRSREFEQMEMEWFCLPEDARQWYEYWVEQRLNWWKSVGVSDANLQRREHDDDELAHYSTACADVEYRYPFTAPGFGELEGIAHRGCYDLNAHQEASGNDLTYFDQELQVKLQNDGLDKETIREKSRYLPHVIEPAAGLTRGVLVLLCEAFTPTPDRAGSKYVMAFEPSMAPIKAAVFPLVAKEGMPEVAEKLYLELRKKWTVQYDVKQSIGKRYARMDEAGTPYCFTVDGETLENQTVTVRDRDTASQERINIDQVEAFLAERIGA